MTDQERKAMEMALDYIKDIRDHCACEGIKCDKEDDLVEALRQQLAQPEQEPTVPDNMQDWAKLDGVTAWHLMERHADNWADVGKMMNEFIEAKIKTAQPEQEPVAWMYVNKDGEVGDIGYGVPTVKDPYIELLYTAPPSKPWVSLTDEDWHNLPTSNKQGCERDAEIFNWIEDKLKEKNT